MKESSASIYESDFPYKVKIIDDSAQSCRVLRSKLIDAAIKHKISIDKLEIDLITPETSSRHSLDYFVHYISNTETDLVICDHILNQNGFANFYGAELVSALYKYDTPCILVTQNINLEEDTRIKEHRRNIPVFLTRGQLESNQIYNGFIKSHREVSLHVFSPDRRPHKTIIRVVNIIRNPPFEYLSLVIPSRDQNTIINVPKYFFSDFKDIDIQIGDRMIAEVNIGAIDDHDLYFSNVKYIGRRHRFEMGLNDE